MIYYLYDILKDSNLPGVGLLNYITFRAMIAAIIAMVITMIFGKKFIAYLQKKQIGETIRDLGLEGQLA
ncbi:MAG: phospho-N-acetylmuramoyl-pentapeptide-transferase, partial [Bacteroidales bacterium]|nr:phospho-N-acetylmuramoyl-pentapeptide-transferase [Bacteroidales bacterium]